MSDKKCSRCNAIVIKYYANNCDECILYYNRTKKGVLGTIWRSQKHNSKERGHRPPEYTRVELKDWLYSQPKFHELYNEWKLSGYKDRLKPSIDRKLDSVHYCFGNIQLMTWDENRAKGIKAKRYRPLSLYRYGKLIGEFDSPYDVTQQIGIPKTTMYRLLKGSNSKGYTVIEKGA